MLMAVFARRDYYMTAMQLSINIFFIDHNWL